MDKFNKQMNTNPTPTTLALRVTKLGQDWCEPELTNVIAHTSVENSKALTANLLYAECVIVRRDEFDQMLKRLEKI